MLEEKATYKVGAKKLPGGTDSLDFSVLTVPVDAYLIPQWQSAGFNHAASASGSVSLGSSVVENATGGLGPDQLIGGGSTNTLKPGGGNANQLLDYGGNNGSIAYDALPDLPASSDIYKGFGAAPNDAYNYIVDWGGTADKLVLPGEASDYYVDAVNFDSNTAVNETLQVYNPTNNTSVYILGQFGEYYNNTSLYGQHGQIESVVFSNGTFSTAGTRAQILQSQNLLRGSGSATTSTSVAREAEKAAQQARAGAPTTPPAPE